MKKTIISFLLLLSATGAMAQFPDYYDAKRNFVSETIVKAAGKKNTGQVWALPVDSANWTLSYFDGLGRPIQNIQWQGSPGKRDIVQHMEYDALGREVRKYLPYAEGTLADALFRNSAAANQQTFYGDSGLDPAVAKTPYPFSQSVLEASPLNRVQEQGAPGATWQPYNASIPASGHTARPGYGSNASGEVPLWVAGPSGASKGGNYYAAGRLYKTTSRDENWVNGTQAGITEEFKDMQGRVVMKRVWETEGTSLSTHYIYDDLGNLRYVVPPAVTATSFSEASDANFSNFIYAYHYDGRKRLIEKKVPGKGWEHMVYNNLDQLVLSQDAVQRGNSQWSFTKYDVLGRVVMTGLYNDGTAASTLRNYVHDWSVVNGNPLWENRDNTGNTATGYTNVTFPTVPAYFHSISYYDDYDFYDNAFGQPNGTTEVSSARTKGLPTGTRITTLGTGTMLLTVSYYDADGRAIATKSQNHLGGTDLVNNTYNFAGELKVSTRTHKDGAPTPNITIIANTFIYDHMGRKVSTTEKIDSYPNNGSPIYGALVTLNRLEYNEIGEIKKKNLHSTDGTNFLQNTTFGYNERGWMKTSNSNEFRMQLDYQDGTYPQYNGNIANQRWGSSLGNVFTYRYDGLNRLYNGSTTAGTVSMSEVLTYDVMGNITSLNRNGVGTATYGYSGNQLTGISGGGLGTGSYAYDANGNATTDGRLGVAVGYNHLNLPRAHYKPGLHLEYTYDATGSKLRKNNLGSSTVTDYVDGIQYTNGVIEFIQTEEGIARNNGGTYVYEYNLTDHLGNVRYTFNRHPTTGLVQMLQSDDYYAFGKRFGSGGTNRYLYNGKELQDELGQYDYGARFYDPEIGRWNVVDPLAEKMRRFSPYNYVFNNPIRFVDPDGMAPEGCCSTPGPGIGRNPLYTMAEGVRQYMQAAGAQVDKAYVEVSSTFSKIFSKEKVNLGVAEATITKSADLKISAKGGTNLKGLMNVWANGATESWYKGKVSVEAFQKTKIEGRVTVNNVDVTLSNTTRTDLLGNPTNIMELIVGKGNNGAFVSSTTNAKGSKTEVGLKAENKLENNDKSITFGVKLGYELQK